MDSARRNIEKPSFKQARLKGGRACVAAQGWSGQPLLGFLIVPFLLIVLPFDHLRAQQSLQKPQFQPLEVLPQAQEQPLETPPHPALRETMPIEGQALEGTVDPQTYILGPGDLIGVGVMGGIAQEFYARIAADGTLRIQTLGAFDAGGRTFADVKAEILKAGQRSYRSGDLAVYLAQLREFKASVGGMVWNPGTYILTPVDRVSSLVALAGGFFNPKTSREAEQQKQLPVVKLEKELEAQELPELPGYSTRHVRVIHRDGQAQIVDLLLFLRAGQPEGNPYLQDGDFLLIPPLNPRAGLLGVYGAVNQQGLFEHLPGDDLERALLLAGGLTEDANRDSLEIARFGESGSTWGSLYVSLSNDGALGLPLQADDRIYVRSKPSYHSLRQVELRGEVLKPGFYPVDVEGTPLVEIIRRAGGFTSRASLKEAVLTRRWQQDATDPEFERLQMVQQIQMNKVEYQYYRTRVQEFKGLVSLDLHALYVLSDSTQNIRLWDQDLLEIPALMGTIKVTGQVNHPGFVDFESGEKLSYYIQKSGDYASGAKPSKIRVIKAVSGKWVKGGHTVIEEGDTIFVPAKSEVDSWLLFKDVLLVVTQVATLYLVAVNASK